MKENYLQFSRVNELIEKIEALKERTRDLLTIEEIDLLDECVRWLKEMGDDRESNAVIWLRVCMTLLRWFTESDLFDSI